MASFKFEYESEDFKTNFTPRQLNKFNTLSKKIVVINGAAYLPINELHGVLLTNSKRTALKIINNHDDIIKNFLVRDKTKFPIPDFLFSSAIKPMGICLLLDVLADENPRRATEYRESSYVLQYIIASHPELKIQSQELAAKLNSELRALIKKLKNTHNVCQLSGREFKPGDEKHVHHIESKACHPRLIAEPSNLIVIDREAHDVYHAWLFKNGGDIDRATLLEYAKFKNYDTSCLKIAD